MSFTMDGKIRGLFATLGEIVNANEPETLRVGEIRLLRWESSAETRISRCGDYEKKVRQPYEGSFQSV